MSSPGSQSYKFLLSEIFFLSSLSETGICSLPLFLSPVSPGAVAVLIILIESSHISSSTAKPVSEKKSFNLYYTFTKHQKGYFAGGFVRRFSRLFVVSTGFPEDVEGSEEDRGPDSEGAGFVDNKRQRGATKHLSEACRQSP